MSEKKNTCDQLQFFGDRLLQKMHTVYRVVLFGDCESLVNITAGELPDESGTSHPSSPALTGIQPRQKAAGDPHAMLLCQGLTMGRHEEPGAQVRLAPPISTQGVPRRALVVGNFGVTNILFFFGSWVLNSPMAFGRLPFVT